MRSNILQQEKGQGILTKPVMIIMFVVAIIILFNSIFSAMGEARVREREGIMRTAAGNTMLQLVGSVDCLAYREPEKEYTNIVDVSKLDSFSRQYANIEPPCARNFDYGWRASIVEKGRDGNAVRNWSFGAAGLSSGRTLVRGLVINSPIGVRYSDSDIRPGIIELRFVDGELELLAGIIDKACFYKSSSAADVALSADAKTSGSMLCMEKNCRQLLCATDINLGPGIYYMSASFSNGKVNVVT
jgi:hypothetical protein